jgi:hypothetical protein
MPHKWVIFEQEKIDHSAPMTHASQPVVNIPDKPVLSDLFKDHLASVGHAHADKNVGEGALWVKPATTSIPVPIEVVIRQSATSAKAEPGTLVSSGWWEGR